MEVNAKAAAKVASRMEPIAGVNLSWRLRGIAAVVEAQQGRQQAGKNRLQIGPERDETARALFPVLNDAGKAERLQMMAQRGIGDIAIERA